MRATWDVVCVVDGVVKDDVVPVVVCVDDGLVVRVVVGEVVPVLVRVVEGVVVCSHGEKERKKERGEWNQQKKKRTKRCLAQAILDIHGDILKVELPCLPQSPWLLANNFVCVWLRVGRQSPAVHENG